MAVILILETVGACVPAFADAEVVTSGQEALSEDTLSSDEAYGEQAACALQDTVYEEPAPEGPEPEAQDTHLTEEDTGNTGEEQQDNASAEENADIPGSIRSINTLLSKEDIMGVLYLCDTCDLKESPSADSTVTATIECGTTLYLVKAVYQEPKLWYLVKAFTDAGELTGYVVRDQFACIDEELLALEEKAGEELNIVYETTEDEKKAENNEDTGVEENVTGDESYAVNVSAEALRSVNSFPDSYREKLARLVDSHPSWIFVPQKVGTSLEQAVSGELSDKDRNWVYYTVDDAYKGDKINSSWYYANEAGLKYYMNPANFVGSEKNIFMFEQLTYNSSYHTEEGVSSVLKGTFMSGNIPGEDMSYAEAFFEIGSRLKVSPYHLASRVIQEQGKGTSPLISGKYSGYEGYYNYFNIQATGKTNEQVYKNGLSYAKQKGWDTRYKSLSGGAEFDSKNYILAGQDTLYLQKYNVVQKRYNHQYMQNASAPVTEASKIYSMYKNSGALNNSFVFKIPVYDGETYTDTSKDPKLATTSVKLNTWKKENAKILVEEKEDNPVSQVSLSDTDEKSSYFTLVKSGEDWEIGFSEEGREAYQKAGQKASLKLKLKISAKEGDTEHILNVTVDITKPRISFKQIKKPNIFYLSGEETLGEYIVASSEEIEGVAFSEETGKAYEEKGKAYYAVESYDKENGLLITGVRNLSSENAGSILKKMLLEVRIAGYYPIPCSLNAGMVSSRPQIKAEEAVLYGSETSARSVITGVSLPEDISIRSKDPLMEAKAGEDNASIDISVSEGFRPGSKKLVLSSEKWSKDCNITVKVSAAKKPVMKLSSAGVKLNSALNISENGVREVKASIKGSAATVQITGITGINDQASRLIEEGYLVAEYSFDTIKLGLDSEKRGDIRSGKYRFDVSGTTYGSDGETMEPRAVRLTVDIVDRDPSSVLTFSSKGSVNLSDREGSYIVYTPKLTDLGAESLDKVSLSGEYGESFKAELIKYGSRLPDGTKVSATTGVIVLRAGDDETLKKSVKYPVEMTVLLNNNLTVTKTVTVKPVMTAKKEA